MAQARTVAAALAIPVLGWGCLRAIETQQESTAERLRSDPARPLNLDGVQQVAAIKESCSTPEKRAAALERALQEVGPWARNQKAEDNRKPPPTRI